MNLLKYQKEKGHLLGVQWALISFTRLYYISICRLWVLWDTVLTPMTRTKTQSQYRNWIFENRPLFWLQILDMLETLSANINSYCWATLQGAWAPDHKTFFLKFIPTAALRRFFITSIDLMSTVLEGPLIGQKVPGLWTFLTFLTSMKRMKWWSDSWNVHSLTIE